MEDFKNLKIDDVFVFYFSSGYINSNAEEELSVREITGAESQVQLNKLKKEYIYECFQESYDHFLSSQDSGWYKKD